MNYGKWKKFSGRIILLYRGIYREWRKDRRRSEKGKFWGNENGDRKCRI